MVVAAALEIWKDSPWFGVGGWGFRYLAVSHLPEQAVEKIAGLANVHNDPVQFLVEFGLIGNGLMALIVLVLARPVFFGGVSQRPALLFAAAGVMIVLLHSLIDLPFRCPAIIYAWLTTLALVGRLCGVAGRCPQGEALKFKSKVESDKKHGENENQ